MLRSERGRGVCGRKNEKNRDDYRGDFVSLYVKKHAKNEHVGAIYCPAGAI